MSSVQRLVVLALGIALLAVVFFSAQVIWQSYRNIAARVHTQAVASAHVIAGQTKWVVGAAKQALGQIERRVGGDPGSLSDATKQEIRDIVRDMPTPLMARVLDANGTLIFATNDAATDIPVDDREFFQELKAGTDVVVSPLLIGRATNVQMFVVAKRLERNGAFAGAVTMAISANMMADFLRQLQLGPDSTVSIFRSDGWLVARYPLAREGMNLSNYVLFTELLPKSPVGSYDALSPADGVSRTVGYVRVEGEPLVALASLGSKFQYEEFWRQTGWTLISMLATLSALLAIGIWLVRVLRREQQAQTKLADALAQNRVLFQEVHHRVKNNLQVVSSLIHLQPIDPQIKAEMASRISAMAAIHEQAYRTEEYDDMSLSDYLARLVENFRLAHGERATIRTELAPMVSSRDVALPLGLLVNEVLANAVKHAFPSGPGEINMTLHPIDDQRAELVIPDNGVGYDPTSESGGIGSRLIKAFVAQLRGEVEIAGGQGTTFRIVFPSS